MEDSARQHLTGGRERRLWEEAETPAGGHTSARAPRSWPPVPRFQYATRKSTNIAPSAEPGAARPEAAAAPGRDCPQAQGGAATATPPSADRGSPPPPFPSGLSGHLSRKFLPGLPHACCDWLAGSAAAHQITRKYTEHRKPSPSCTGAAILF